MEVWSRGRPESRRNTLDDDSRETEDMCFVYPILQPIPPSGAATAAGAGAAGATAGAAGSAGAVAATAGSSSERKQVSASAGPSPWSTSTGFLRFSVFFANPFNRSEPHSQRERTVHSVEKYE